MESTGTAITSPIAIANQRKAEPVKSKGGRPKGITVTQISGDVREMMFQTWCEVGNIREVSRVCGVARQTAKRYRELDNWDERYERLEKCLVSGVSSSDPSIDLVKRGVLQDTDILAAKCLSQGIKLNFSNPKDAIESWLKLRKMSLALRGEVTDRKETILTRVTQRYQEATDPKSTTILKDGEYAIES